MPDRVADLAEIAQLIQRYGLALDDRDFDQLERVFTPDARTCYEMGDVRNDTTWPKMRRQIERFLVDYEVTQHLISHPVIDLDGDEASSVCRLIAMHRKPGETDTFIVYGTYRDTLTRTPQGWRIHSRHFQATHTPERGS